MRPTRSSRPMCGSSSRRSRTCATARTRTRRRRSTASATPRRTRSPGPSSSRARRSPTTTSSTPTRRGAAVREFDEPACVIVKHTNPCGTAIADDRHDRIQASTRGRSRSRRSAASWRSTGPFRPRVIQAIYDNEQFVEVMIAPDYEPAALELLAEKPNAARAQDRRREAGGRSLRVSRGRGRHARSDVGHCRRGSRDVHGRHQARSRATAEMEQLALRLARGASRSSPTPSCSSRTSRAWVSVPVR